MALSSKKIILKSIDDETFEVDKAVALQMQQIKEPIEEEEDCADTFFPVLNVKGGILSKAANYLDIKGLSDLTCRAVAEMIKGKNIEEIKRTFNIGELTPEEEAWAFE